VANTFTAAAQGLPDETTLAAVIGSPVAHSLSPTLLNAAFAAAGLTWHYTAVEVAPGEAEQALNDMRSTGLGGLSVTMPHKTAVANAVDRCTETATLLNAVNCVAPQGQELVGHNTDGEGFLGGLAHDANFTVAGCRAVVLGAGGAARAVVLALAQAGANSVTVINRTAEKAQETAQLAGPIGHTGDHQSLATADLIVNATSVGMHGGPPGMPCDPTLLHPGQVAIDLIYHPLVTPWMAALKKQDIEAHNGVSMLLFQAARAFNLWTNQPAPIEAMENAVTAALEARSHTAQ
jgi:shikimate dehydrogenase